MTQTGMFQDNINGDSGKRKQDDNFLFQQLDSAYSDFGKTVIEKARGLFQQLGIA